jgi:type II secretory pathway pseudopilin PulG
MLLSWKIKNHRKGETILETLIAMGILVIGIMMASSIMGSSIRNINSSKNRVIAVNIAKEGLEAIRNIRDTNWLKFNSVKRECWNHEPIKEAIDPCPIPPTDIPPVRTNPIKAGDYIVYKQPIKESDPAIGWKWRLEDMRINKQDTPPPTGNLNDVYYTEDAADPTKIKAYIWDGKGWVDLTQLYTVDLDPLVDSNGDHNYTNDPDTYNHALVKEDNALGKDFATKTNFQRQITIHYLTDAGLESNNTSENRMVVRSKVTWREGKNEFSTDLATHLSDYMGRENLN